MLAATLLWVVLLLSGGLWLWLRGMAAARAAPPSRCGREPSRFSETALPAVAATPTVAAGAGLLIARSRPMLKHVEIRIRGLHPDLNGLRLAQITDIHYGPFFGRRDLEYAVAMANSTRPHVALVTGDLITRRGDDLEGCLNILQSLRGEAGVWACHGNHERYAGLENAATRMARRRGFHVLRGASELLRFGAAKLNLAGVDYQSMGDEPLAGAEDLLAPDAPNLLLCHTPLVFDRAAELGFDLMISGHTHGGQLNLPLGFENLTFVRLYTPYIQGHYRKERQPALRQQRPGNRGRARAPGRAAGGHTDPPMRRLILSDIHGNLEALEAVSNDARGRYEEVVCCGDIVGYGASPSEAIAWIRQSGASIVRGNHDRAAWEPGVKDTFTPSARTAAAWCAEVLSEQDLAWLRDLPVGPIWRDDFGLVHGSPEDEDAYLEYTTDVRGIDRLLQRRVCFLGHTHVQGGWQWLPGCIRRVRVPSAWETQCVVELDPQTPYLINPGSVGQPRDNDPRAAYAVWDAAAASLTFRRVAYDIDSAQRRIVAAGLPESLALRLTLGR